MAKDNLVDIEVEILSETDKAWRVHDGVRAVWVPKSQVEIELTHGSNRLVVLTMPEWLAVDKELA